MTARARPPGFAERLGAAVFAPARAARLLCSGGRGGWSDAALLMLPRLGASQPQLVTDQLSRLSADGPRALPGMVLALLSALLPDLLGISLGAVVMSLLLGKNERLLPASLTFGLCAQAWQGWLFVHVLSALLLNLIHTEPGQLLRTAIQLAALLVWVGYAGIGFLAARQLAARLARSEELQKLQS